MLDISTNACSMPTSSGGDFRESCVSAHVVLGRESVGATHGWGGVYPPFILSSSSGCACKPHDAQTRQYIPCRCPAAASIAAAREPALETAPYPLKALPMSCPILRSPPHHHHSFCLFQAEHAGEEVKRAGPVASRRFSYVLFLSTGGEKVPATAVRGDQMRWH